jgi:hypothetical protein
VSFGNHCQETRAWGISHNAATAKGPAETFTSDVWVDLLAGPAGGAGGSAPAVADDEQCPSCLPRIAAPGLNHLARIVKRNLKKIQYRPHLITGCRTATGLTIEAS